MAIFNILAAENPDKFIKYAEQHDFKVVPIIEGHARCYVAIIPAEEGQRQRITIIPSGTNFQSFISLKQNAKFGSEIHGGYQQIANTLISKIQEVLGTLDRSNLTIDVTGHSAGGPLANLISYELHENGYDIGTVVTMGTTHVYRSGPEHDSYEEKLGNRTYRITFDDDPIPSLQTKIPQWLQNISTRILGGEGQARSQYKPVGKPIFISSTADVSRQEQHSGLINISDKELKRSLEGRNSQGTSHQVRLYAGALGAAAAGEEWRATKDIRQSALKAANQGDSESLDGGWLIFGAEFKQPTESISR